MNRSFFLFSLIFIFAAIIPISAQDNPSRRPARSGEASPDREMSPNLRRQALTLDIESRVLGAEKTVVWSEFNSKETLTGNPVGVQLTGSNVVVAVQFTPFIQPDGNVLVAQGQIWIADSYNNVTYYTSIQTVPMEFGEKIYFFPLGSSENLNPSIEIIVTVSASEARRNPRRSSADSGNER